MVLYIQTKLRNKREDDDRKAELTGLIRIIDPEMAKNEDLLQKALDVDAAIASGQAVRPFLDLRTLEVTDWDKSKVRLAHLANGEHFKDLDDYYRNVRNLLAYMAKVTTLNIEIKREIQRKVQKCKGSSDEARQKSQNLLGSA